MAILSFGILFIIVTTGLGYLLLAEGLMRGTSFFNYKELDRNDRGRKGSDSADEVDDGHRDQEKRNIFRFLRSPDTVIMLLILVGICVFLFYPLAQRFFPEGG